MVKFTVEVKWGSARWKSQPAGPSNPKKRKITRETKAETEIIDDYLTEGIAMAIYTSGSK
jgi:hypothetical protein